MKNYFIDFMEKKYHTSAFNNKLYVQNNRPILEKTDYIPKKLLGIDCICKSKKYDETLHTFVHDHKLETVWHNCEKKEFLEKISKFPAIMAPDFSAFLDMPTEMIQYNVLRSQLVSSIWQHNGLTVIPVGIWAGPNTYEICFNNLPKESTIAVSTVGVMKSQKSQHYFELGLREMINVAHPSTIIMYGAKIELSFELENAVYFENTNTAWTKEKKHG